MKLFKTLVKIVLALAAIAGAVYVLATYGEKIVAWCKKVLASCTCCCCEGGCVCCEDGECTCDGDCDCCDDEDCDVELVTEEDAPVAEEADFEG